MAIGIFMPTPVTYLGERFTFFGTKSGGRSFTFSDVDFGAPDSGRYILVVIPCYHSSNPGSFSISIGGVSATILTRHPIDAWAGGVQAYAKVTNGWSGDITITHSAGNSGYMGLGVYRLVDVKTVPTSGIGSEFTGSSHTTSVSLAARSAHFTGVVANVATEITMSGVNLDAKSKKSSHMGAVGHIYTPTAMTLTRKVSITGSSYKRVTGSTWIFN